MSLFIILLLSVGVEFIEKEELLKQNTFVLEIGDSWYYGASDDSLTGTNDFRYEVSSSAPLEIYVVESHKDFKLFGAGAEFTHYPKCRGINTLSYNERCKFSATGGIILANKGTRSATVQFKTSYITRSIMRCGDGSCQLENNENCEKCRDDCGCPSGWFCNPRSSDALPNGCSRTNDMGASLVYRLLSGDVDVMFGFLIGFGLLLMVISGIAGIAEAAQNAAQQSQSSTEEVPEKSSKEAKFSCGYCGASFIKKMYECPHCGAKL